MLHNLLSPFYLNQNFEHFVLPLIRNSHENDQNIFIQINNTHISCEIKKEKISDRISLILFVETRTQIIIQLNKFKTYSKDKFTQLDNLF